MRKFILGLLAAMAIIAAGMIISKTSKEHLPTIAVLNFTPAADTALEGLKEGLVSLGYIEGKNIQIIYHGAIEDKEELQQEAYRLAALHPDIFYSMSTPATQAAKKALLNTNIPLIFGPLNNPLTAGIVSSLNKQKTDITGVTFGPQEERRFDMMTKVDASARKILIPYVSGNVTHLSNMKKISQIAIQNNITIVTLEIDDTANIPALLQQTDQDIGAVFAPTDATLVAHTKEIADFAKSRRIPFSCPQKEGVAEGALFSYGFSIRDVGFQAARLVHLVLKGNRARDIPIEMADFKLTVNTETAALIGIRIPDYILSGADIIRGINAVQP